MLHSAYTLWQHDQTKCRKPVGARGCGGCWRTACQALELLGLTRSRSKFSFLIRRWGNQFQTWFLYNPFLSQNCFLHEPLDSKFFPTSLRGLTADVQRYLWPLPGPGQLNDLSASSRRVLAAQRSWRMLSPFLLDLNAAGRAQRRRWFLLQKLSLAGFGGSHRKPIRPYTKCFHKLSLHLWGYLHVLPYLIPNPQFLVRG